MPVCVVSIHAPRVGCDLPSIPDLALSSAFQFTHPVWGATAGRKKRHIEHVFQFTHPVWGATKRKYEYRDDK